MNIELEGCRLMKQLFQRLFSTKKQTSIEFCQKNLDRCLDEKIAVAFSEFLQQPHISYKEYECLSKCTSCQNSAYALVNGHYVEADDMQSLLQSLTIRASIYEKKIYY